MSTVVLRPFLAQFDRFVRLLSVDQVQDGPRHHRRRQLLLQRGKAQAGLQGGRHGHPLQQQSGAEMAVRERGRGIDKINIFKIGV